ncbi:hypothetical protein CC80DRAFT_43125 [Byssothecium circinans]|uniref:SAC3/GANP/THP3 conserved domain-containing protein n=1 Tax=Byssothecium circinans TaxID=147558 RepID=A0A6A5TY59_9PLEO|nr:hypothetical protein CC80DRAFT_43125 [Byssothecium circinans]
MNPPGRVDFTKRVDLVGSCTEMCPEYERVRRINERDFKAAECTPETAHGPRLQREPDETRMVKAFTRSAAGAEEELITEKRTPTTCLRTLAYMFGRIEEDGHAWLYPWIWDRTRSIRKDIHGTVKPKEKPVRITCLEQCVRWHLLSMHDMAGSDSPNYDQYHDYGNDIEQLNKSRISLKNAYHDNTQEGNPNPQYAEFAAYDVLIALQQGMTTLDSLEGLRGKFKGHPRVEAAFAIYDAAYAIIEPGPEQVSFSTKKQLWANYWQAVNEESVSFLMACAAEMSFNKVRVAIMRNLGSTYKPRKNGKPRPKNYWTPENLIYPLGFDNAEEVREFVAKYEVGFVPGEDGSEVIDVPALLQTYKSQPELRHQYHSKAIVEAKREGRSSISVIQANLKENNIEDSLFVPDKSAMSSLNPNAKRFAPPPFSPFKESKPDATPPGLTPPASQIGAAAPAASIQPGLFDPSKRSIQFANNNMFAKAATEPTNIPKTSTPTARPFIAQTTKAPDASVLAATQSSTSIGFSPNGFQVAQAAPQPSQPSSQVDSAEQQEERRKAEEQRIADQQRRAQEEQERRAREAEQQRRFQEEQERQQRIQAERQRQAQEEAHRQAQEEAHRQAQVEYERRLEAERRRQAEEAARYEQEEKARAYNSLATNLLMGDHQGLMSMKIEHMIDLMFKEAQEELRDERLRNWADQKYQEKRLAFARAVCVKWWEQIQKKKKRAGARLKRQNLKALRARAAEKEAAPEVQAPVAPQVNGTSNKYRQPEAPASHHHAQRPQQPQSRSAQIIPKKPQSNGKKAVITPESITVNPAKPPATDGDYSEAYYKSTAPIDRTETKWFELRAMGVDPSQHLKRKSLEMDDGEHSEVELKRVRRSPTSTLLKRKSLEMDDDEQSEVETKRVRRSPSSTFRASSTTPLPNQGTPILSSATHDVIRRARELLAGSNAPQHSPPNGSRRSVSSGFSQPVPQLSMFGRNIGAAPPTKAPAYRNRTSRFVPQHLYGKGAEAVRAYREQYCGSTPIKNEPLQFSSPVPTQQSYAHTGETQPEHDNTFKYNVNEPEDAEDADEESLISYSDAESEGGEQFAHPQHEEFGRYNEGAEFNEGEEEDGFEEQYDEYDEEGDEELEMDGGFEQYAQQPGATHDDAIELSD